MTLTGTTIRIDRFVTGQGYAFATRGYHTNGLATQQGLGEVLEVGAISKAQHGKTQQILLAGVSEGNESLSVYCANLRDG